MKNWFNKNYKTIIILAFLIPIITVALVSISHVTKWYGISNPLTWAVYLSIGIEIAALSALAAISANMGRKVYFPFGIVTLIQFIGNIYFAYSYIDINSQSFTSWVELVSPLLEFMGVEPTDYVGHKRFLAFFAGGMLPIISLSFLHMLVKFTQGEKTQIKEEIQETVKEEEVPVVEAKDIVGEVSRVRLNDEQLEVLEKILSKKTSEELVTEEKKSLDKIEPEVQQTFIEETPIENEVETVEETPEPIFEETIEQYVPQEEIVNTVDNVVKIEPTTAPTPTLISTATPTPEEVDTILPEKIPMDIPIMEIPESIVEESNTEVIPEEPIVEETVQQVEESPIIELPTESEEEKKNY